MSEIWKHDKDGASCSPNSPRHAVNQHGLRPLEALSGPLDLGRLPDVGVSLSWSPANEEGLDIQSNLPRVRFDGKLPFANRSSAKHYLDDSRTRSIITNLPVGRFFLDQPKNERCFSQVYESYKRAVYFSEGSFTEYGALVVQLAKPVIEKLSRREAANDCIIAIPTRRETCTSHAVHVILEDLRLSQRSPLVLVLHNDTNQPSDATLRDLERLRCLDSVLVFDLKVHPRATIGEMRALLADVAMEAMSVHLRELPIVFSDADVTNVFTQGSFHKLIGAIERSSTVEIASGEFRADEGSLGADVVAVMSNQLAQLFWDIRQVLIGAQQNNVVGCFFAINPSYLAALGGIPRVEVGEDHLIGVKALYQNRTSADKLRILMDQEAGVYVKMDRNVAAFKKYGSLSARYAHFDEISNTERPVLETTVVDIDSAIDMVNVNLIELSTNISSFYLNGVTLSSDHLLFLENYIGQKVCQFCSTWGIPVGKDIDLVGQSTFQVNLPRFFDVLSLLKEP